MIGGLLHVGVSVKDLEESVRFYRDVLGMEEEYRTVNRGDKISRVVGVDDADMNVCVLRKGDIRVELLDYGNTRAKKNSRRLSALSMPRGSPTHSASG